jgi:hypothetical protein
MSKSTTKTVSKKEEAPQEFPMQQETIAFLKERIADGGATTDQMQVLLNKLEPAQEEA